MAGLLTEDLHRHGALASDGVRVVVGVHIDVALFFHQFQRIGQRLGEAVAVQHHLAAARAHAVDLDLRGGLGHHDGGLDPHVLGRQRQALGVIARRGGDHATGQLLGREVRKLVIGATNLERVHRLQVFALEQNLVAGALGELAGLLQRGFYGDVIDARGEDLLDVLFEHRTDLWRRCGTGKSTPAIPAPTTATAG